MTKIKIVTDSSVTIEPEVAKELDITMCLSLLWWTGWSIRMQT